MFRYFFILICLLLSFSGLQAELAIQNYKIAITNYKNFYYDKTITLDHDNVKEATAEILWKKLPEGSAHIVLKNRENEIIGTATGYRRADDDKGNIYFDIRDADGNLLGIVCAYWNPWIYKYPYNATLFSGEGVPLIEDVFHYYSNGSSFRIPGTDHLVSKIYRDGFLSKNFMSEVTDLNYLLDINIHPYTYILYQLIRRETPNMAYLSFFPVRELR